MMAVLAASCSSDMIQSDFAEIRQDGSSQDVSEKIDQVFTKSIEGIEMSGLFDMTGACASFARELLTRDYISILAPQIQHVISPDFEEQKLYLDFSRLSGEYAPSSHGWAYAPHDSGEIVFNFNDYNDNDCKIVTTLHPEEMLTVNTTEHLGVKIPLIGSEKLYMNDSLVTNGSWTTLIDLEEKREQTIIMKKYSDYFMYLDMKAGIEYNGFNFYNRLMIMDTKDPYNISSLFRMYATNIYDNDFEYEIVLGDSIIDDFYIKLDGEINDIKEFASLLASNVALYRNPSDSIIADIRDRVSAFNEAEPLTFYFISNETVNDDVFGWVILEFNEPDSLIDCYHVDMAIKYYQAASDYNYSTQTQTGYYTYHTIQAPVMKFAVGIRTIIESYEDQIMELMRNGIDKIRSDIEEFYQINSDYFSKMQDFIGRAVNQYNDVREMIGKFYEFIGGFKNPNPGAIR